MRKPTSPQVATLERIRTGYAPNATPGEMWGIVPLTVLTFESAVTGDIVQCHRTCHHAGVPRAVRTEFFRIAPDGFARQV